MALSLRPIDGLATVLVEASHPYGLLPRSHRSALDLTETLHGKRHKEDDRSFLLDRDLLPLFAASARGKVEVRVSPQIMEAMRAWQQSRAVDDVALEGNFVSIRHRLALEGKDFFPYQLTGARFLSSCYRGLLGDQMGLGKTLQATAAIPVNAAVIVTCPKILKENAWQPSISLYRPDLAYSAPKRLTAYPRPGEVLVFNPEAISEVPSGLPPQNCVLIADEAHMFKNPKAKRTQLFRALRQRVHSVGGRVWGMTGTPLLNRPTELSALLETFGLMAPSFGNFGRFYGAFNAKKGDFGTEWGQPKPEVHQMLAKVMLRRLRSVVLPELPTKTYRSYFVETDAASKRLSDRIVEALGGYTALASNDVLDSAPQFAEFSQMRAKLAALKIPAMLSLVDEFVEQDEPLVVFSDHRAPIEALAQKGFGVITGLTPSSLRKGILDDFQNGKLPGIGLTIDVGGVGLTLVRAAHVLFVDRSYVPAENQQAEDRCVRIGQTRGVTISSLLCDHPLDRRVEEINRIKIAMIDTAVDGAPYVAATA